MRFYFYLLQYFLHWVYIPSSKKEKDVFCGLCLQKTSFLYGYKVIKEKNTKKQCEILAKFKLIKY